MKLKSFFSCLILSLILLCSFTKNGNFKTEGIEEQRTYAWEGTLNNKIKVSIQYSVRGKLIEGEIIYLSTPKKIPKKLLGKVQDDKSYRILEFDKTGNITGIITGQPRQNTFKGSWFSPKTGKELSLSLLSKKQSLPNRVFIPGSSIFGEYSYQYDKDGYSGTLSINKIGSNKASFEILSVTSAPAYNIAQVEKDTISLVGNKFTYTIPNSDCTFKVAFYEGYATVSYANGDCTGQFGHNATIDGIFLKVE